jgi:hypothetical protein
MLTLALRTDVLLRLFCVLRKYAFDFCASVSVVHSISFVHLCGASESVQLSVNFIYFQVSARYL